MSSPGPTGARGRRRTPERQAAVSAITHINDEAFLGILISAIEAFPSKYQKSRKPKDASPEGEVYGVLFGYRTTKGEQAVYNVSLAVPMQILSVRKVDRVVVSDKHLERVKGLLEAFPNLQFLGTFHSHPFPKLRFDDRASVQFSEQDKDSALSDAKQAGEDIVEVIIGLTFLSRREELPPSYLKPHVVRNYCGNYKYSIPAYVTESGSEAMVPVDNLLCPMALGIGNYDLLTDVGEHG